MLASSLTYNNTDLAGNVLNGKLYSQRFRARYGGGIAAFPASTCLLFCMEPYLRTRA
ncbi:hypothetical protein D9M71_596500 [compost metagenome]